MPILLIAKKDVTEIKKADPNKIRTALKLASLRVLKHFLRLRVAKTTDMIKRMKKLQMTATEGPRKKERTWHRKI